MRQLFFWTWPVAVLCTACASDDVARPTAPLYPPYRSRSHAPPPPAPNTLAYRAPATPARPAFQPIWYPRGRPISSRWTHIVLHHSATQTGGAASFDRHHRVSNGWDELGYHFVIGNGTDTADGYVEVGPRWHKQKHGAHCKTPGNYFNDHGIGICLVGDFTRTRPTYRQLAALEQLLRFLCATCRIPSDRVTTHHAVKAETACPGRFFPTPAVRHALTAPRPAGAAR